MKCTRTKDRFPFFNITSSDKKHKQRGSELIGVFTCKSGERQLFYGLDEYFKIMYRLPGREHLLNSYISDVELTFLSNNKKGCIS